MQCITQGLSERERPLLSVCTCINNRVTSNSDRVGRTTLSEVEDDLVPGEDDLLNGPVTDNSNLEGERGRGIERERVKKVRGRGEGKEREGREEGKGREGNVCT